MRCAVELCSFLKTLCPRSTAGTQTLTRDGETQNVPVPALAHHAKAAAAHGVGADAAKAQRTRCAEADREVYQLLNLRPAATLRCPGGVRRPRGGS